MLASHIIARDVEHYPKYPLASYHRTPLHHIIDPLLQSAVKMHAEECCANVCWTSTA